MTQEKLRWLYRFDNYQRAFALLADAVAQRSERPLSQLEKQGMVQCFELSLELAWKVLKDYLENSGTALESATPKNVIRAAFQVNLISDGEGWIDALDARNLMAHSYDSNVFEKIVTDIAQRFYPLLNELLHKLQKKADA